MREKMTDEKPSSAASDVTVLLKKWRKGDAAALDALIPLVHTELSRIARRKLKNERPGHVLETGGLLNEAFIRLVRPANVPDWQNRRHFYGIAANIMRQVLLDEWRKRRREIEQVVPMVFTESISVSAGQRQDFAALDEALDRLSLERERVCKVVELRYFCGLSVEETADVLNVAAKTVKRDWQFAQIWLRRQLKVKK